MTGAAEEELLDVVRRAWIETLPATPFDPDLPWEESDADSLKSLQFLMRLETALGRKLSFDLISMEMTPRSLAAALSTNVVPTPGAVSRPLIHLVPGLYGDAPALAAFRKAMADTIDFALADLPALETPVAVHEDMAAMAAAVADGIMERSDDTPLTIAGFSFGGMVAIETVRNLQSRGHDVALLILFDPPSHVATPTAPPAALRDAAHPGRGLGREALVRSVRSVRLPRFLPADGESVAFWRDRLVFAALLRLRWLDLARRYVKNRPASLAHVIWRRKAILGLSRQRAIQRWMPEELRVPVLLVLSKDGRAARLDRSWAAICPDVRVVDVPVGHAELLEAHAGGALKRELLRAVGDIGAGRWP